MNAANLPVVLPTLNEEQSIELLIRRIQSVGDHPIWVVDGYSEDDTVNIARRLGVTVLTREKFGKGYGCAILRALEYSKDMGIEYLLVMDCDNSYHPEDLPILYDGANGFDLVLGCRNMSSIAPLRRFGNLIHSFTASILFGQRVSDVNTGMRLIRVPSFCSVVTERGMGMMPQISSIAMRLDYTIREVSINYSARKGLSKVRFSDAFVILWCIIRERFGTSI